jgi:hypothetical protein
MKRFIPMAESVFQHLVNSINKDYSDTYVYLRKNFDFIRELINKLALHIGCNPRKDIYVLDKEGVQIGVYDLIQDAIFVENDCSFSFKLLISLRENGFNINSSGRSFFEKSLVPPSGIVMYISIKQEDDIFTVTVPSIKEEKIVNGIFKISSDNSSWTDLLESLTQVLINFSNKDLKYRISQLSQESSQEVKPFGFNVTPDVKIVNTPVTPDNNDV